MTKVVLDPVTRIEGHLGIEVSAVPAHPVVSGAGFDLQVKTVHVYSNMYRGFENILKGRDPRDAIQITQRICGVCPVPHGTVSTFAIENAMGWSNPISGDPNSGYAAHPTKIAGMVRNLSLGSEFLMSHITHFYALAALDFVQAAQTSPTGTAQGVGMSPWTPSWHDSYYDDLLKAGPTYPATGLSWDASGNPQNVYTAVITDYVLALSARRKATDMGAIFGGRTPIESVRIPGGVSRLPTAADIAKAEALLYVGVSGDPGYPGLSGAPAKGTICDFIQNHYIPMTEIVSVLHGKADNMQNTWHTTYGSVLTGLPGNRGPYYGDGLDLGAGCRNFLSWGAFEDDTAGSNAARLFKRGSIIGATNTSSGVWEDINPANVMESIGNAHYRAQDDWKNPYDNVTYPDTTKGYTWHKSPRYKVGLSGMPASGIPSGAVKEVGPLARMWISGYYNPQNPAASAIPMSNHAFSTVSGGLLPALGPAGGLGLSYKVGISVLDRHRARAQEACIIQKKLIWGLRYLLYLLCLIDDPGPNPITGYHPTPKTPPEKPHDYSKPIPLNGQGCGLSEAPRGSVAHWVKIKNGKIDNYAVIAPTTWNASGRDTAGNPGPIEQALQNNFADTGLGAPVRGVPSNDKLIPVEALIVIHSFDPCIACSVHVVEPKKSAKKKLSKFEVEGGCKK